MDRHIAIVRRHIFGGEPRSVLCADLRISTQQFYVDRRRALKYLSAVTGADVDVRGTAPARAEQPKRVLLAHAQSLFNAGASLRSSEVLQRVLRETLQPRELLSAVAIGADVHEDVGRLVSGELLLERCRYWLRMAPEDSDDRRMAAAAFHWLSGEFALRAGDERTYGESIETVPRLLQPLVVKGDGDAVKAQGAFWNHVVHSYPGNPQEIEPAFRKATDFLETRGDLPVALHGELRASRGYLYASSLNTLTQARRERDAALAYALQNTIPRALWMSLYLSLTESVLRDDLTNALEAAAILADSVRESDSLEWQRISKVALSGLYIRLGMVESAERLNGHLEAAGVQDPAAALDRCVLLVARKQYRQALLLATRLIALFEHPGDHVYRAKALQLSAISRHHLGDAQQAAYDIRHAIELYQSLGTWLVYTLRDAYRAAYEITKESRYRDIANDLRGEPGAPQALPSQLRRPARVLTPRQREIAALAASGKTNREIAGALGLSHRTVGNHLATIFDQLGIRARWQLEEALRIPQVT
ncbi:MAG TPA: helix-turn-helix transcriptional regulator [Candidatus Baltobacteraceae bacterium]|nr:helix-turn-helix transcriptional regulator [Candidatus Baltobacteraceae bacterium]